MSKTRLSSLAQLMRAARPARDRMRARLLALADWRRFHDAALRSARARHGSGLDVRAGGAPGGQALHEFQRRHDDMGGAVFERALQLQHHLAGAVTLEPVVGDRRAGDIAAQVLQFLALIGAPAHRRSAAQVATFRWKKIRQN